MAGLPARLARALIAIVLMTGCGSSENRATPSDAAIPVADAPPTGDAKSTAEASTDPEVAGLHLDQASVAREPASDIPASVLGGAVAANNAFAWALYGQMVGSMDSGDAGAANVLISPLSASLALTMTYAGAAGQTATEMASVLHADLPDGGSIFDGQNALGQALGGRGAAAFAEAQMQAQFAGGTPSAGSYELQVVNSVWGEQTYAWSSGFLDVLAESFGTGIYLADFIGHPASVLATINEWVDDQTDGAVPDLLSSNAVDASTRIVLVNAMHLRFPWATPFSLGETMTGTFTRADGSTVSTSFMNLIAADDANLPYADDGQAQIVALPTFGGDEEVVLALPHAGTSLAQYEEGLAELPAAPTALTSMVIAVPKLTLGGSTFSLVSALQDLGMNQAFVPGSANFTGMCPPPDGSNLYIGEVLQQTTLTMEEDGIEATAATAVGGYDYIAVSTTAFTANRPFLIEIVDVPTGAVLFVGHVMDPTTH